MSASNDFVYIIDVADKVLLPRPSISIMFNWFSQLNHIRRLRQLIPYIPKYVSTNVFAHSSNYGILAPSLSSFFSWRTPTEQRKQQLWFSHVFLAGCAGGVIKALFACPIELSKVRLQVKVSKLLLLDDAHNGKPVHDKPIYYSIFIVCSSLTISHQCFILEMNLNNFDIV